MNDNSAFPGKTYRRVPRVVFLALVFLLIVANGIVAIVILLQLRQTYAQRAALSADPRHRLTRFAAGTQPTDRGLQHHHANNSRRRSLPC